ncbi:MAG TPA: SIMPL domain-containing protein [Bryobacteraceae bacterium]|nr:SIMPL domain-containing protein [Bryobacteraceae bacterium]
MLGRTAVACFLLTTSVIGAEELAKAPHVVRASGDATVTAAPDRARISIGVQNQAATAQQASSQNAAQTTRVLQVIRQALGSAGEVKTENYSVSPQYRYPKDGSPAKIVEYRATNTVQVTIDDLSLAGKVIDAATQSGANNVEGISFQLKDEGAVRSQALAEAAVKARASAEAIAKALNLHVVGVLQAEASGGPPPIRPMMRAMAAGGESAPSTPVEPGNLEIHASVTVTLQVQ